jgi:serine/threonine protein kinase
MNFLCPACRTPLPPGLALAVVPCTACGVEVDLTRLDTAPGASALRPDVDLVGETLGGYRLSRRLGAGGMGIVYAAEGPAGRCAVKVLASLLSADPALRTRFRREASALRAVSHAGVVRVLDDGEERGFSWYAMELVEGSDLRAKIAAGPLEAKTVEALARTLLAALAAVHGKGFIHRDVKPGNVLLARDGTPKLCDFGIAHVDGATTLTASAAILGSLRYMAPEQRLGRASQLSDLYSLGVTLHEALTGGVPEETPLPRAVPRRLRRLLEALTAPRGLHRPASATAALALLDARSKRLPIALAAALVALLVLGIALKTGPSVDPLPSPKLAAPPTPPVQALLPNAPAAPPGKLGPLFDNPTTEKDSAEQKSDIGTRGTQAPRTVAVTSKASPSTKKPAPTPGIDVRKSLKKEDVPFPSGSD